MRRWCDRSPCVSGCGERRPRACASGTDRRGYRARSAPQRGHKWTIVTRSPPPRKLNSWFRGPVVTADRMLGDRFGVGTEFLGGRGRSSSASTSRRRLPKGRASGEDVSEVRKKVKPAGEFPPGVSRLRPRSRAGSESAVRSCGPCSCRSRGTRTSTGPRQRAPIDGRLATARSSASGIASHIEGTTDRGISSACAPCFSPRGYWVLAARRRRSVSRLMKPCERGGFEYRMGLPLQLDKAETACFCGSGVRRCR